MEPHSIFPDRPLKIAILGSSGAVGQELLQILSERLFPIQEIRLLASPRSAGRTQIWQGKAITVQEVTRDAFEGVDLVLASAGGSVSREWREVIKAAGALLIDNSSAFRMENDVPLIVPEVNPHSVNDHHGVIANPNCTTILLSLVLGPLAAQFPIKRVVVSTYQSASGAGALAMEELKELSQQVLNGQKPKSSVLPNSLAFNLFLHNSPIQENKYCEEEMKMINETRKILELPKLNFTATCVRVPVLRAHSEAVNIEFEDHFDLNKSIKILEDAPGIEVTQDFVNNRFPMPTDVTGKDLVSVGRIRKDISNNKALELWLCGDQIRKGAALNAIQIAELLLPKL
ncbi:aspartate-semialdehyde dehydrogenase [Prochlorococcus sp. MIT 1223]|uniref:aspartate-semialdehyde dehydrogenase n=1 Tax=Prochlorococcus sp. MIT 1223 TaxID=3096217 RepID=UPI002A750FF7|nr:aspartate-semialdehyde dehydrogenase [Prochlorococcus sp. MIT 1223]